MLDHVLIRKTNASLISTLLVSIITALYLEIRGINVERTITDYILVTAGISFFVGLWTIIYMNLLSLIAGRLGTHSSLRLNSLYIGILSVLGFQGGSYFGSHQGISFWVVGSFIGFLYGLVDVLTVRLLEKFYPTYPLYFIPILLFVVCLLAILIIF
ncbi:hypothetical protein [Priestia koreensis]|uniref:hypothetical protein n=1 Tax=Priestia koreensis TaxID=284581 RepID=UPI0020412D0A|nr:hypothetical protein [Priestia koreensis]MCM3005107.1 hypothetical protein [Priestia koreensis]